LRVLKIFQQLYRGPEVIRCFRETSQWLALTLNYVGIRSVPYPYQVTLRDGCHFTLANFYDATTFWQVFFNHVYPVRPEDRVIVDAGGNVGSFSLYALRAAPASKVIAVEPFPQSFDLMQGLVNANGLADRYVPVRAALGGAIGTSLIEADDRPSQFRRITNKVEVGEPVSTITLEQLFAEQELEKIDYLKVDIEGSEYATLLAAPPSVLARVQRIGLEYHPLFSGEPYTRQQLFAHLERSGFEKVLDRDDGEGYGIAQFRRAGDHEA
jgi:FkbM family methyltransferase